METDELKYISKQITKAERRGYFDKANYPNFCFLEELLKMIRSHCDKQISVHIESEEIDRDYPWPEPP